MAINLTKIPSFNRYLTDIKRDGYNHPIQIGLHTLHMNLKKQKVVDSIRYVAGMDVTTAEMSLKYALEHEETLSEVEIEALLDQSYQVHWIACCLVEACSTNG